MSRKVSGRTQCLAAVAVTLAAWLATTGIPNAGSQADRIKHAAVLHIGETPTGERYGWVGYRAAGAFCTGLDWPGVDMGESLRGCEGRRSKAEQDSPVAFASYGYRVIPSRRPRKDRDIAVVTEMRRQVFGMRLFFTDDSGTKHRVPVDFQRIDGALLKYVGGYEPFGVFVAVLDGRLAPDFEELDLVGPKHPEGVDPPDEYPDDAPETCRATPERGPLDFVLIHKSGRREKVQTLRGRYTPPECQEAMSAHVRAPCDARCSPL